MATSQKPSMAHKIVGTDAEGIRRERPFEKGWQAEAEVKRLIKRGWTNVEVQSWKDGQFKFSASLNKHLEDADEKRTQVNEDAVDALTSLSSVLKSVLKSASDGSVTEAEIIGLENACMAALHNLGVTDYASTR